MTGCRRYSTVRDIATAPDSNDRASCEARGLSRLRGRPVGASESSPAMNRWDHTGTRDPSPVGTSELRETSHPSLRDSGGRQRLEPSDESLGLCQMSLRDKVSAHPWRIARRAQYRDRERRYR